MVRLPTFIDRGTRIFLEKGRATLKEVAAVRSNQQVVGVCSALEVAGWPVEVRTSSRPLCYIHFDGHIGERFESFLRPVPDRESHLVPSPRQCRDSHRIVAIGVGDG